MTTGSIVTLVFASDQVVTNGTANDAALDVIAFLHRSNGITAKVVGVDVNSNTTGVESTDATGFNTVASTLGTIVAADAAAVLNTDSSSQLAPAETA